MRFTIYKNSVLATICSMFGAACIVLAVTSLIRKELDVLSAVVVIAAGVGLMWLGSVISERKAAKKQAKAAAQQKQSAAEFSDQAYLRQFQRYKEMLERGELTLDEYERKLQALKKQQEAGITCPHCQKRNTADSRFCAGCGRPITRPAKGVCSHCNHQNAADSRFCAKCGRPIS